MNVLKSTAKDPSKEERNTCMKRTLSYFLENVESHLRRYSEGMGSDISWVRYLNYPEKQIRADFHRKDSGFSGSMIVRQLNRENVPYIQVLWKGPRQQMEEVESIYGNSTQMLESAAERIGAKIFAHLF